MSLAFLSRKKSMFLFSLQYNSEAKVEKKDELVCETTRAGMVLQEEDD